MSEDNDVDAAGRVSSQKSAERWAATVSSRTEVDFGACTDRGKVRSSNEDHFFVTRFERSLHTLLTSLPAELVPDTYAEIGYGMLVADGMGGAAAGEVASSETISTLIELVLKTPDWIMRVDEGAVTEVLGRFDARFAKLREALIARAQADPSLSGMGTTMTLAASLGPDLIVAHLGNSRAYLFHKDRLHLLTRDQTMAQDLADVGMIPAAEVRTHRARRVLTGAITTQGGEAPAELCQVWLADGDQVLLCTDGLTEMVTEAAIIEVLERSETAAEACQTLVDLALEGGGKDNVTVVLARYRIPEDKKN